VHCLTRGLFPELWRDPQIPSDAFYQSYLATYIERDVRQLLNVGSLRDFERFLRACAARSGQLLNKSDMGYRPHCHTHGELRTTHRVIQASRFSHQQ
jgi:predicted AAA+ superfamily ATPase